MVLNHIREDQIEACVGGLSIDELDTLVKYVYKGLGVPRNNGPLFKWHAKVRWCLGCDVTEGCRSETPPDEGQLWGDGTPSLEVLQERRCGSKPSLGSLVVSWDWKRQIASRVRYPADQAGY